MRSNYLRLPLRKALCAGALLLLVWSTPGLGAAWAESPGTATISAAQMKDYLTFIASDEMEGRATPSRGQNTAAKFISTLLARWGVKPGGDDGSFFQKIAMTGKSVIADQSAATLNGQKYVYGEDFLVRVTAGAGAGTASGTLIYAGDGWFVRSRGIDAYKGLDVRGKIVIVNEGGRGSVPRGVMPADLQGKKGEDWADPATYAAMRGAVGILYIAGERTQTNWARFRRFSEQSGYSVDRFNDNGGVEVKALPALLLNGSLIRALFAGEKIEAPEVLKALQDGMPLAGFDLKPDKQFAMAAAVRVSHAMSQNVVGIVEGSDPALKGEYVGVSAHYDHLGLAPSNGDAQGVYNGADDDGSGTVGVLAIAEAASHAESRPKRSLLFVWHMGEETGLLGSKYFTMFPTVPLKQVDAFINIDMIGRSKIPGNTNAANKNLTGPNEIYVIGATVMSSDLDALCRQVNANYLNLTYNFKYDDPKDPEKIFYRSDHFNYARQGIPILFYFDGVHEDYHQMSDKVDKIDFGKMERVTRTIYQTLWELASLRERPKVDKPLPPQLRGQ